MSWYTWIRIITFGLYRVPFNHNPDEFLIKVIKAPSLFGDLSYIQYSANNGLSWRYLMEASQPMYRGEKWSMERFRFNTEKEACVIGFLSSYQDVLNFEERERQIMKDSNKGLTAEQRRRRQQILDTLNQKIQ